LHRQGLLPAGAVEADQLVNGAVLSQQQRMPQRQLDAQLFGQAAEAGAGDDRRKIQQQLGMGTGGQFAVQQAGYIGDRRVMEDKQGLSRNTATDVTLANG